MSQSHSPEAWSSRLQGGFKKRTKQNQDGCRNAKITKFRIRLQKHYDPSSVSGFHPEITRSQPSPVAKTGVSLPLNLSFLRSPINSQVWLSTVALPSHSGASRQLNGRDIKTSAGDRIWGGKVTVPSMRTGEKDQELGKRNQKTR